MKCQYIHNQLVSAEFRRNSKQVDRQNFIYIEYLLRCGKKQLDQLKRHFLSFLWKQYLSFANNLASSFADAMNQ
jgi:hypothetical protein